METIDVIITMHKINVSNNITAILVCSSHN